MTTALGSINNEVTIKRNSDRKRELQKRKVLERPSQMRKSMPSVLPRWKTSSQKTISSLRMMESARHRSPVSRPPL